MADISVQLKDKDGNNVYPVTSLPSNAVVSQDIINIDTSDLAQLTNILKPIVLQNIYPVGSIYLSTNNVDPGTIFGGQWESFGEADTYLRLGGNGDGGSNNYSLTEDNIPSHTHTVGAHSHGINSHTHSIPALSGTAANKSLTGKFGRVIFDGAIRSNGIISGSEVRNSTVRGSANSFYEGYMNINATHNHSVTTTASTTGSTGGSTTNSTAFDTGAYGSSTVTSIPITPKYVQTYAWKRIA